MQATRKLLIAGVLSHLSFAASFASAADAIPAYIAAAVADSARPAADVARDVNRKPGEVLTFAGVKLGDKVGEMIPGRGYFTTLFCKIVGANGHVYTMNFKRVVQPDRPPGAATPPPPPAPACDNVTQDTQLASEVVWPTGLDVVWTSENYHDLLNKGFGAPDMVQFNKAVFTALKPGGVYMVEDHAAAAGAGATVIDTLHRIDPELVKQQVVSAGFVFEGASTVLQNPDDPHTERAHLMEGKSDKFLLKFRKPKK